MAKVSWILVDDFNVLLNMQERSDYFQGMPVQTMYKSLEAVLWLLVLLIFILMVLFIHGVATEE